MLAHSLKVGEDNIHFSMLVHFVQVFPTATAAVEYTRIMVDNKDIGEEAPPLFVPTLTSICQECQEQDQEFVEDSSSNGNWNVNSNHIDNKKRSKCDKCMLSKESSL
jgi:hypothetical protein